MTGSLSPSAVHVAVLLVVAALTLGAGNVAPVADATAKPKTTAKACPAGTVAATAGRRRACLGVPGATASPQEALRRLAAVDLRTLLPKRLRRQVRAADARRARTRLQRAMAAPAVQRLLAPGTASRASRAATHRARASVVGDSGMVDAGNGLQGRIRMDDGGLPPAAADEVGSGSGLDIDLLKQGKGLGFGLSSAGYAKSCPDADGDVPLRGAFRVRVAATAPAEHRLHVGLEGTVSSAITGVGHVGDDGHVRDYDARYVIDVDVSAALRGPANLLHGDVVRRHGEIVVTMRHVKLRSTVGERLASATLILLGDVDQPMAKMAAYGLVVDFDRVLELAERHWYDEAACLRLDTAPGSAEHDGGDQVDVTAQPRAKADGAAVAMRLHATPSGPAAGSVAPADAASTASAPAAFAWTLGQDPGAAKLSLAGVSKRGRAAGSLDQAVRRPLFPARLRILDASIETMATVRKTTGTICAPVGGLSGSSKTTGSMLGSYDAAANVVTVDATGLHGQALVPVPVQQLDELDGCTDDLDGGVSPCHASNVLTPQPDGRIDVGFTIKAPKVEAVTADAEWSLMFPSVGYQHAGNAFCNVYNIYQELPYAARVQDLPISWITDGQPHTVTLSDPVMQWTTDALGQPAAIDYGFTTHVTFQRVG